MVLGMYWRWFAAGFASPCVCESVFIEMIGRHYWHGGAKDAKYPIMLHSEGSSAPVEKHLFFVHLAGRVLLTGAVPGGDRLDLAVGLFW